MNMREKQDLRLLQGLRAITDTRALSAIRHAAEQMIEAPVDVSLEWAIARNWAIVPVGGQPDIRDCEWICEAAMTMNVSECVVLATEPPSRGTAALMNLQPAILDQAVRFEHLSLSNLAFFPMSLEFLVIKEAGDYFLIAGPQRFVTRAAGSSLAVARQLFDEAAERAAGDTRYTDLTPVAERYRPFDG
jgi:hypothetical protein